MCLEGEIVNDLLKKKKFYSHKPSLFHRTSLRSSGRSKKFYSASLLSRNLSFNANSPTRNTGDLHSYRSADIHQLAKTINLCSSDLASISSKDITVINKIGEGEFGYVFQGMLTNKRGARVNVAIKNLKALGNYNDFLREGRILFSLKHSCIISIYGVCHETKMLALELAKLGSMDKYLRNNSKNLTIETLKLWSFQIADGMKYLEFKKFIHRY